MNRYYSAEQYVVMREFDECAMERPPNWRQAAGICLFCGNTTLFWAEYNMMELFSYHDGNINVRGFMTEHDLLEAQERMVCARCSNGPVLDLAFALNRCRKDNCSGCFYCGKVTPMDMLEARILNCQYCHGGEQRCDVGSGVLHESNCSNRYMRDFHLVRQGEMPRHGLQDMLISESTGEEWNMFMI